MKIGPKTREFLSRVERSKGRLLVIQLGDDGVRMARKLMREGLVTTGHDETLRGAPETVVITDAGRAALAQQPQGEP